LPLAIKQILSDTDAKANMTKRLYVGGLPNHVTDEILADLFSVMINQITDLSDGFGFVEMSCESEAQAAIQNLNGTQFEGRTIKVHEARPRLVRGKVFKSDRW